MPKFNSDASDDKVTVEPSLLQFEGSANQGAASQHLTRVNKPSQIEGLSSLITLLENSELDDQVQNQNNEKLIDLQDQL